VSDKQPTFEEWLAERKVFTNENRARAQAYHDSALSADQSYWKWIVLNWQELNSIYTALGLTSNYQLMGDRKLAEKITSIEQKLHMLSCVMLGLGQNASEKDIEERAKEFGKFAEQLIQKGKEWEALAEIQRENK